MRTRYLLTVIFLLIGMNLTAQSNRLLDEFLEEDKASFGRTVYLVLVAAEIIPEEMSIPVALNFLRMQDWGMEMKSQEEAISLGEYSFLIMKAFEMRGGLMYGLFPSPRYACRELAFLGLIKGEVLAYRTLSGEEVLRILERVLNRMEEQS